MPRNNSFEAKQTPFLDAGGNFDFVMDDSAIVITDDDGIMVVTGCLHAGVCNVVQHAIDVTGISTVKAVIGGFHLKHDDDITAQTVDWLKSTGVKNVIPTYCTGLEALSLFSHAFGSVQIKTGLVLDF